MKMPVVIIILIASCFAFGGTGFVPAASAQSDREFIDTVANYKIVLVDEWQPVQYRDAVGRLRTEFTYHSRNEGLLTISKESLDGHSINLKIRNDLKNLEQRVGFVYSEQTPFTGGRLNGVRVLVNHFDNVHKFVSWYYYLLDGDVVWVLQFSAGCESKSVASEITDKIARSFCSVCPIE